MAVTTKSEPRTMSPPANTFGFLVWNLNGCSSGATTRPDSSIPISLVANQSAGLGRKPKAMMTASHSMISSELGIGSGRRLPRLSGLPN